MSLGLKDIHLPLPIGWWPPAIGWYLLLLIFLIMFFLMTYFFRQYRFHAKPKKQALKILKKLQAQQQNQNAVQMSAAISLLLRRVAQAYYPVEEVANLQGEAWLNFLTQCSDDLCFGDLKFELLVLPYQKKTSYDLSHLYVVTEKWIRQRRKRCLV